MLITGVWGLASFIVLVIDLEAHRTKLMYKFSNSNSIGITGEKCIC